MFNRELIAQARRGIQRQIEESPSVVTLMRQPLVSDGFGGFTPSGTPVAVEPDLLCRVSHERAGVQAVGDVPAGLDTNLTLWLLVPYDADVRENDTFEFAGRIQRVGRLDPLRKFDGVQGIQAPLYGGDEVETGLVTGVALNDDEVTVVTTFQLVATVAPDNAINKSVTWSSSAPLVATVSATGLVTAIGPGTAIITVTTVQGSFTATCEVTVA
jgi:hypothetical protein